jgi:O-antigen ligase
MEVFNLAGDTSRWMPLTVSPEATWLSLLGLLPPVAIFLGTIQLRHHERRWLSLVVLGFGVLSVFLGLTQIMQGPSSPLRFFTFTNNTEAVGFFANRNDFSALLYCLTVLASAWAIEIALNMGAWQSRLFRNYSIALLIGSFTVLVILIAGQTMARSRGGLVLTMVAIAGALALTVPGHRSATAGITPRRLLLSATALAVVFAVQFSLYRILDRFEADPVDDARIPFAENTISAAKAYMPFGSGMGSFIPVYNMFDKPRDAIPYIYANHAHNDVLEVWLETGIFGIALFLTFAVWFARRAADVWRPSPPGAYELDYSLGRASTLVIVLLFAHSFVEYPLRTDAMTVIFAFSCALLVEPLVDRQNHAANRVAQRSEAAITERAPMPTVAAPRLPSRVAPEPRTLPQHLRGRWGEDIEWPEEWTKTKEQHSAAAGKNPPTAGKPANEDET